MENTSPKEILENIINVMEKTKVDEWEIDKLVVVLNYINDLEQENIYGKQKNTADRLYIIDLQDRIDKAIEYIGINEEDLKLYDIYDVNGIELLKILRGKDNGVWIGG